MSSDDKCVLVDNEHDLNEIVQAQGRVIALVYASWCPFCRRFLPVFQQQSQEKQRHFLRVQDDRETVAEKYEIDVFPTLLFFEDGAVVKRLDGAPGAGLNEKQLTDFIQLCSLPED